MPGGIRWCSVVSVGARWYLLVLGGILWCPVEVLSWFRWYLLVLGGICWFRWYLLVLGGSFELVWVVAVSARIGIVRLWLVPADAPCRPLASAGFCCEEAKLT